jgi:3-isopropylmalate dehydrogenase
MLNYLEEKELAQRLEDSIARVIEEGKVRTYDLGGTSSTLDVAREVAKKVISNE